MFLKCEATAPGAAFSPLYFNKSELCPFHLKHNSDKQCNLQKFNYICNIVVYPLALRKTYKNLISGFLLLLYLFIATPVQLWHHHTSGYASDKTCHQAGNDLLSPYQAADNSGSDCKICSHSYSAHATEGPLSIRILISYQEVFRPDLFCGPNESSLHLPGNKSPPSGPLA